MRQFQSSQQRPRLGGIVLAIGAIALAFACSNAAGSSSDEPSVQLGSQSGVIAAGTVCSAAFSVVTANVADGTAGAIAWYSTAAGTGAASAPTGITTSVSAVSGNAATVTVTSDGTSVQGSYYFKLTEDSAVSSVGTLRVADWELVGAAAFSAGSAYYLSLKLGSSDVPYLAYRDGGNSNKATVMRYDSSASSWSALDSAGFSAGEVQYTCLALDSDDVPYVSANSTNGTVWRYDSSSSTWSVYGAVVGTNTSYNSMAFDSNDVPYVIFNDGASSGKVIALYHNGAGWTTAGTATGQRSTPRWPSIRIIVRTWPTLTTPTATR